MLGRLGPRLTLDLRRPGFFPAGGGAFQARLEPVKPLARLDLLERGGIRARRARALVSRLSREVAERELAVLRTEFGWQPEECAVEIVTNSPGPGNALMLEIEAEQVTAVFSAFGDRGRRAEEVAQAAAQACAAWVQAEVPVEEHLADQLLLPLALAGGGSFRTTKPSPHSTTNAVIIERFLATRIRFEQESELVWRVAVEGRG